MRGKNGPYRPDAPTVPELASGAVVLRRGAPSPEVLLLHLVDEDRWCLPKGHVEPGESLRAGARREVVEESGIADLTLGEELCEVSYRFFSGSRQANVYKSVVYFLAHGSGDAFRTERLFDRAAWTPIDRAVRLVPYPTDRTVLRAARRRLRSPAAP
jgi:8-oxo-dGTP pyrophosphatase MutT (NUDIX family)